MAVANKETGEVAKKQLTVDYDTCNRAGTTYESLAKLAPVKAFSALVNGGVRVIQQYGISRAREHPCGKSCPRIA